MTLKGTLSDKALSLREIEILRLSPRTEVFLYDGVAFYLLWVAASSPPFVILIEIWLHRTFGKSPATREEGIRSVPGLTVIVLVSAVVLTIVQNELSLLPVL